MTQPPQTENDAPETMALPIDVEADFDKVIQWSQLPEDLTCAPTDIEKSDAQIILFVMLQCTSGIQFEDITKIFNSWDDAGKDLDIIRQCVATSTFQPALGLSLHIYARERTNLACRIFL
jgi:hypothetical protein